MMQVKACLKLLGKAELCSEERSHSVVSRHEIRLLRHDLVPVSTLFNFLSIVSMFSEAKEGDKTFDEGVP